MLSENSQIYTQKSRSAKQSMPFEIKKELDQALLNFKPCILNYWKPNADQGLVAATVEYRGLYILFCAF